MNDYPDDIDDQDGQPENSIAVMFNQDYDWRYWPPGRTHEKLDECLRHAVPFPPKSETSIDPFDTIKEAIYNDLRDRAADAILSGELNVKPQNGVDWVVIIDFYQWLKDQGEEFYSELHSEFRARDPSLNKSAELRTKVVRDVPAKLKNGLPWRVEAWEIAVKTKEEHPDWGHPEISKAVAITLRDREITGRAGKVVSADNIKRHVLKGHI